MSQKLADITQELFTGAHPSVPNDLKPLWDQISNLLMFDGAIQASPGHFLLLNKLEQGPAIGLMEAELRVPGGAISQRTPNLFWGNMTKLFRFTKNDGTVYDASRLVGGAYGVGASPDQSVDHMARRWSFVQWGEWVGATNGHDIPQLLKNTTAPPARFVNLTDGGGALSVFTQAEIFRRIAVFAVALNTSDGGDYFRWSDEDDIEVWTPSPTNSAGSLAVRHLNSQIMAAETLGVGLGIYGRDQLHHARYVGPPGIIGADKLLDGIGAWGKDSVCSLGGMHYGWGPRGIWGTDGSSFRYFDDPSIRNHWETNLNLNQTSKIVAFPLTQYGVILFFYPKTGSLWNNAAYGLHIASGTWWPQDYGRQCAVPGTVFDFAITGSEVGDIYMVTEVAAPPSSTVGPLTLVGSADITGIGVGEFGVGDLDLGGGMENITA